MLKLECRKLGRNLSPTPIDSVFNDIETLVAASFVKILCERDRHAANATADIEHPMVRHQTAETAEILKEFVANDREVAISHICHFLG
jgi:hypothetical protein